MPISQLEAVLVKYSSHPDFLGVELTNPNQKGAVDDTPLHIAARKGEIEDVEILLVHGAAINASGDLGNTALHYAAMTGKIDVVSKLLQRGASPNIKNEFGQTPEKIAELGRHKQVVEIIRKHGKK